MSGLKDFFRSQAAVIISGICLIWYFTSLQYISPVFYDPDGYYHAAVTNTIKHLGLRYPFHWAQFSLFKDFFSDKDLLFHVFSLPFFYPGNDLVQSGKHAIIFYNILFIAAYAWLLRKYLSGFFAALFLLLPALSAIFVVYFLQFRSLTLANILTLLAIYCMINKRSAGLFVISLLYPLAHISFFMLIPFVLLCEGIRRAVNREFSLRNVYTVLIGVFLGVFIHPNFPNNLLSFHLNGILVPLYTAGRVDMDFGGEFNTRLSNAVFLNNFMVFLAINLVLWAAFFIKKRHSFATFVWLGASNIYLALSFFSNRYWYTTNAIFFIFFASYLKDILEGMPREKVLPKTGPVIALCLALNLLVMPFNLKEIGQFLYFHNTSSLHYSRVAEWMKRNIPPGETVYHASWSDAPYFICLNPQNNYINVLDPIYMFYRYPAEFLVYKDMIWGRVEKPYEPLQKIFKVNYGYTRRDAPLYFQVAGDPRHFKIAYEDATGIVFKLLTPPPS